MSAEAAPGSDGGSEPFGFFCHVMKTGGTSLRRMLLRDVLDQSELAPHVENPTFPGEDTLYHYINPFLMKDDLPADRGEIRVVAAHYPYLIHRLMPRPLITFSLFRDPVERVVSHLKHLRRDDYPDRSLEEIYGDRDLFDRFFYNLQARAFVFEDQRAKSLMVRTFDWDEETLERAKRNVETVDVIGLSSEFPTFVANLESAFGWRFGKVIRTHRSPSGQPDASEELRRRIRDDLSYDRRFYEHVLGVYREREAASRA